MRARPARADPDGDEPGRLRPRARCGAASPRCAAWCARATPAARWSTATGGWSPRSSRPPSTTAAGAASACPTRSCGTRSRRRGRPGRHRALRPLSVARSLQLRLMRRASDRRAPARRRPRAAAQAPPSSRRPRTTPASPSGPASCAARTSDAAAARPLRRTWSPSPAACCCAPATRSTASGAGRPSCTACGSRRRYMRGAPADLQARRRAHRHPHRGAHLLQVLPGQTLLLEVPERRALRALAARRQGRRTQFVRRGPEGRPTACATSSATHPRLPRSPARRHYPACSTNPARKRRDARHLGRLVGRLPPRAIPSSGST